MLAGQSGGSGSGLFICYRRGETTGHARAIKEHLAEKFKNHRPVFMDVDSIMPAVPFGKAIGDAIRSSGVILVLIGRDWTGHLLAENRFDDPEDYVRLEIETALQCGIPTLPILIERTPMPDAKRLPESLRSLVSYEAIDVENNRWAADMSHMVLALERILRPSPSLLVLGPIAVSVPLLIFTLNYVSHYKTQLPWQALVAGAALAMLVATTEYRRSRMWIVALEFNCLWFILFGIYKLGIHPALPSPQWKVTAAITLAGAGINAFFFIPALISVLGRKRVLHPLLPAFLGLMTIGLSIGFSAHFPHHGYLYKAGALVLFVALLVNLLAPFLALARRLSTRAGKGIR